MANAYSTLAKTFDPISTSNADLAMQVMSYKEAKFEANQAAIDDEIAKLSSIDLVKAEDSQYFADRLSSITSTISEFGSGNFDLTSNGFTRSLKQQIGQVYDENILTAYQSSQLYRSEQKSWNDLKAKGDGKYSADNHLYAMQNAQKWLADGQAGASYSGGGSAFEYQDYKGKTMKELPKILEQLEVKGFEKVGSYSGLIDLYNKTNTIDQNKIKSALEGILTPQDYKQMQIDSWGKYKNVSDEDIAAAYGQTIGEKIGASKEGISDLTSMRATAKNDKDRKRYDDAILSLKSSINDLENNKTSDRDSMAFSLFREDFIDGLSSTFAKKEILGIETDDSALKVKKYKTEVSQWERKFELDKKELELSRRRTVAEESQAQALLFPPTTYPTNLSGKGNKKESKTEIVAEKANASRSKLENFVLQNMGNEEFFNQVRGNIVLKEVGGSNMSFSNMTAAQAKAAFIRLSDSAKAKVVQNISRATTTNAEFEGLKMEYSAHVSADNEVKEIRKNTIGEAHLNLVTAMFKDEKNEFYKGAIAGYNKVGKYLVKDKGGKYKVADDKDRKKWAELVERGKTNSLTEDDKINLKFISNESALIEGSSDEKAKQHLLSFRESYMSDLAKGEDKKLYSNEAFDATSWKNSYTMTGVQALGNWIKGKYADLTGDEELRRNIEQDSYLDSEKGELLDFRVNKNSVATFGTRDRQLSNIDRLDFSSDGENYNTILSSLDVLQKGDKLSQDLEDYLSPLMDDIDIQEASVLYPGTTANPNLRHRDAVSSFMVYRGSLPEKEQKKLPEIDSGQEVMITPDVSNRTFSLTYKTEDGGQTVTQPGLPFTDNMYSYISLEEKGYNVKNYIPSTIALNTLNDIVGLPSGVDRPKMSDSDFFNKITRDIVFPNDSAKEELYSRLINSSPSFIKNGDGYSVALVHDDNILAIDQNTNENKMQTINGTSMAMLNKSMYNLRQELFEKHLLLNY
jgi:hypothetical protein